MINALTAAKIAKVRHDLGLIRVMTSKSMNRHIETTGERRVIKMRMCHEDCRNLFSRSQGRQNRCFMRRIIRSGIDQRNASLPKNICLCPRESHRTSIRRGY